MKLLLFVCLLCFEPAPAQEIRPGVVTVSEDADALLPCSLSSEQKVEKFDWRKDNGENAKKEVFFYERGSHYNNGKFGQDEQFKQRVSFFEDELKTGNASIKIKNTHLEDNGTYICVIFEPYRQEIQVRLNVGAAPEPHIKPIPEGNNRSLLECKVKGVPKPDIEWRNSAGDILAKVTNGTQLYVNVTKSDKYTCVATQMSIFHQINNTLEVQFQDVHFVSVGEEGDVVLPCSLNSKEIIKNMHFEWRKDQEKIYVYNRGQVNQGEQFEGRVTHFKAELKFGNASIKIHNTQLSDSGRYTCSFSDQQQSQVELHVVVFYITEQNSAVVIAVVVAVVVCCSVLFLIGIIILVLHLKGYRILRPHAPGQVSRPENEQLNCASDSTRTIHN